MKCNMTPERKEETLKLFDLWTCEQEEERARDHFDPILFYEDGRGDSRTAWCTASRMRLETTRKRIRGKHKDEVTCPICNTKHRLLNVNKYSFYMNTLVSYRKMVFVQKMGDALLLAAGTMRRDFNWDQLFGELSWRPEKLYYLRPGEIQKWDAINAWRSNINNYQMKWAPRSTITEPFAPNMFGDACYDGSYITIGLENLTGTPFQYSQIEEFFLTGYENNIAAGECSRYVVKYLAYYAMYPQIEMAVKLGLQAAVDDLIENGKKNHRLLNWNARTLAEFMRMSKQDAKTFIRNELYFNDLEAWRELGKGLTLTQYIELQACAGGTGNIRELAACARTVGVALKPAVKYISKHFAVNTFRDASSKGQVIRTWRDYLDMAQKLGYDLDEPTVAMPKNLHQRHDTAAALIEHQENEREKERYQKRYRLLDKKYAFTLGGLTVVVPKNSAEIVREGKTLHHCVVGYADRHINGSTVILFLRHERRPERSFLTIELSTGKKPKLRQIHGYRNEDYRGSRWENRPAEKYKWFLDAWLDWVHDGSPRDQQGRPIMKKEAKTA